MTLTLQNVRALLRSGARTRLPVTFLTLVQLACAGGEAGRPADDIAEHTPGERELLVLGASMDNPEQEFSRVVGARMVGDSAVLVVSAGTHDMRLFSRTGTLLRRYGREGEGPGENRGLGKIFMRGDTLWAFDVLLNRVDVWSLEEGYLRTIEMPLLGGAPVWTVFGVFADGALLGGSSPRSESAGGGTTDTHMELVRWVPGSAEATPVDTVFWDQKFIILQANGSTGFRNPLTEDASVAVTGSTYWYTDGRAPTLQNFSASGELLRTVELPFEPDPIGEQDRERFAAAWMERLPAQSRQRVQRVVDDAVYPDRFPAITDLVVARDGSLWAGEYVKEGQTERRWFVLSADGQMIKPVSLPAEMRLHGATGDAVVGARRDELGVERVIVYARQSSRAAN